MTRGGSWGASESLGADGVLIDSPPKSLNLCGRLAGLLTPASTGASGLPRAKPPQWRKSRKSRNAHTFSSDSGGGGPGSHPPPPHQKKPQRGTPTLLFLPPRGGPGRTRPPRGGGYGRPAGGGVGVGG